MLDVIGMGKFKFNGSENNYDGVHRLQEGLSAKSIERKNLSVGIYATLWFVFLPHFNKSKIFFAT